MAFEATKREWGELYAFFRLLADGYVYAGTPDVKRNEVQKFPVAMVQREEHGLDVQADIVQFLDGHGSSFRLMGHALTCGGDSSWCADPDPLPCSLRSGGGRVIGRKRPKTAESIVQVA